MTVRIGLVGAGAIAHAHAQSCWDLGLPFGVYGRGHAGDFARRWSTEEYETYDRLLEACDIVLVATPTPSHEELVLAALAAGRDVICEKPLTVDADAAQRMADAALAAGKHLFPAHVVRWFPAYVAIRHRVASGELGRLTSLRLTRAGASPWQAWFHEESGGGLTTDLMIHDYDQALWLAGEVEDVRASRWYDDGGEHAHVELRHASGLTSQVEGTWGPPGTAFTTTVDVSGESGTLHHDSRDPSEPYESPYTSQLRDLVSACTQATTPRVTVEDGIRAVRVAEAVREALSSVGTTT
jgi:predicted dehydrogenase